MGFDKETKMYNKEDNNAEIGVDNGSNMGISQLGLHLIAFFSDRLEKDRGKVSFPGAW